MAKADDDDVREAAREVLLLDHDGEIDAALARAHALAAAHPESPMAHRVVSDLRYAAAVYAASRDQNVEFKEADAALHLRVARDALEAAKRLAPNCVDIAAAYGDVLRSSKMFQPAESEFRRAGSIACPDDPAENNAAYGMYDEDQETTAADRVEEAKERARRSYMRMTIEDLVPIMVEKVLELARLGGAAVGRDRAKHVAESFPTVGRAQYLHAYMDLQFVRGLDASIDRRAFLRRTLTIAERAVKAFPRSPAIASFHAKLLFVLGEYHAAEMECRRGLCLKDPDDPMHDCIPLGSIVGDNRGERLVSLSSEFHELNNRILMLARDYWEAMSSDRQQRFLSVRLDVLQDEYNRVDPSRGFTLSDAQRFVMEKGTWRYWTCPICESKKFLDTDSVLSHMCSKHPRAVLPRLQTLLDRTLIEKAVEDESLDGVSFCQDSDNKGIISFDMKKDIFKWLFYSPSSGIVARPFKEIQDMKREKAIMLLESIKEKMKNMPADKSAAEFAEALPEINELWHNFLVTSVVDYRAMIATIARSYLWKELKRCMTEDHKAAAQFISTADIDAVFTKGDDTNSALEMTEGQDESEAQQAAEGADNETAVKKDAEVLDPPSTTVTESTEEEAQAAGEGADNEIAVKKDAEVPDPLPTTVTESTEEAQAAAESSANETAVNLPVMKNRHRRGTRRSKKNKTAAKDAQLPAPPPINVTEQVQAAAAAAESSSENRDAEETDKFFMVGTIPCYYHFQEERALKNLLRVGLSPDGGL